MAARPRSCGFAPQICSALLACGMQNRFESVLDGAFNCYKRNPGFRHPDGVVSVPGYGNTKTFARAWQFCRYPFARHQQQFRKDEVIAQEIAQDWMGMLPSLPRTGKQLTRRVIYIDDDLSNTEALPPSVTLVKLPTEGEGIMSPQGHQAMARAGVDLKRLGPEDVVVWDFDCTLSSVHFWKTLNLRRTPEPGVFPTHFEQVWGAKLMRWWREQSAWAHETLATSRCGKVECKAPSRSRSNVLVFQDDEYSCTHEH